MIDLTNQHISGQTFTGETLVFGSGWQRSSLRNCELIDCEILFEQNARGALLLELLSIAGGVVKTIGSGVVGPRIIGCRFEESDGIRVTNANCDVWIIDACQFSRSRKESILYCASGLLLSKCHFENKADASCLAYPHIAIEPGRETAFDGGLVNVTDCECYGDVGTGGGPPSYAIRLGPEAPTTGTMTGVQIRGLRVHRPAPEAEDGYLTAIHITKALKHSEIGGYVAPMQGAVIQYDALTPNGSADNVCDIRAHQDIFEGQTPTGWIIR